MEFTKWTKYLLHEGDDIGNNKHAFYKVTNVDIIVAEQQLGHPFPKDLKDFFKNVGYGFLCCDDKDSIDRLMDPKSIADFMSGNASEEDRYVIEYCKQEKQIPFLEIGDGAYVTMDLRRGRVYYFENVIANSLEEFLDKMDKKTDYYLDFDE